MSVITSLMYAAGALALLAVVLECCCRRRLRELRDEPHIVALNGVNMNNVPYPVETSFPTAPPVVSPGGTVIYPMPMPTVTACDDDTDLFFRPHLPPQATHNVAIETPPPSYEQVMATERCRALRSLAGAGSPAGAGTPAGGAGRPRPS